MSPVPHKPTKESRARVSGLAAQGVPQDQIAPVGGISLPTLHKYYRHELDEGAAIANAAVVGALYANAIGGNVSAQTFWCKTRLGWRETNNLEISTDPDNPPTSEIKVIFTDEREG